MDEQVGTGDEDARIVAALSGRWPKGLAGTEAGTALARRWVESRAFARRSGEPPHPHHRLTPALVDALFEVRRARRLVRGLEACESALAHQAAGVEAAGAKAASNPALGANTAPPAAPARPPRVSRLLVVSSDGADRFYRSVERLARIHQGTLEVLVVPADELELGQAIYGPEQRVRAVLVEHKEAVARVLGALDAFEGVGARPGDASPAEP